MNVHDSKPAMRRNSMSGVLTGLDLHSETLPTQILLILAFTVVATALCLPLLLADSAVLVPLSWGVCVLCGISILLTAKRTSVIAVTFILGFFLISYTGTPILTALLLGSIICTGGGAAMICAGKGFKTTLPFLLPALSFVLSLVITRNPILSLSAIVFCLPMIALGISGRMRAGKTASIATVGLITAAIAAGAAALFINQIYGELSRDTISAACSEFCASYVSFAESALIAAGQETIDPSVHMQLQAEADLFINSAPGLVASICLIAAYLAHNMQYRVLETAGIDRYLTASMTELTASVTGALVFIIAHILTYTTSSSGGISLAAVVGANLCYILMPLLVLKGYEAFKLMIEKFFLFGLIAATGIAIAIFALSSLTSSSVLIMIALLGALYVIIAEVDKWAKEYYGKGELNE